MSSHLRNTTLVTVLAKTGPVGLEPACWPACSDTNRATPDSSAAGFLLQDTYATSLQSSDQHLWQWELQLSPLPEAREQTLTLP